MTRLFAPRSSSIPADIPDRAVIDIGSNTVRLVVYSGPQRAPETWLNEKVSARLGRDLSATGLMPEKAMEMALAALARYAAILPDIGVTDVQTVATAAVRDAANGAEFLDRVRALGLHPRLLSGEEEAQISAYGVIGAFAGARGTVADLGGGSLELVMVEKGGCHDATSLPLGTLRLPALKAKGAPAFRKAIEQEMKRVGWAAAHPGPLYLVGGTWRAFAAFVMHQTNYPLTDPHGFLLGCAEADAAAKQIARTDPAKLAAIPGVASSRAVGLPDAAAMLRVMLRELQPDGLIFSSWGLREGLLYHRLPPAAREQDALLAGIGNFTTPRGGSAMLATTIAAWTAEVADSSGNGNGRGGERLRLAAIMLALAAARVEPNLRTRHACDWAMDKRWLGLDHNGRARIATAVLAACGKPAIRPEWLLLASEEQLREAAAWGLAARLCRRLGAGSRLSLMTTALRREGNGIVLWFDESRAQLISDPVRNDLKALGEWLGRETSLRVGTGIAAAGEERSAEG